MTPQAPRQETVQASLSAPLQHERPISSDGHTASSPETSNDDAAPTRSTAQSGVMQARVLSQPLPVLPDDLREVAYQAVAVARFVVHVDGTFDVELVKPTQNPRLNQILLETLRTWRFFPAMDNGHPVESHRDVRVHFNVD
ncbi:TonB family protein [Paraburkholderia sp. BL10I2N1]|nr:TonB family protein [Paraburkholderia sp. BL10I2N1]